MKYIPNYILGKSFDITYIRIVFYSPRPESFAIYKRERQDGAWIPYQYYSATCRDTYGLPDTTAIKKGEDESRALCTSEYSDISPLRDGNIAFSSLEGRPSAIQFEHSPELQVSCFAMKKTQICLIQCTLSTLRVDKWILMQS